MLMLSIGLWRWYINITITILDIMHHPVLCLKTQRFGDWILTPSSGGTYSDGPNRKSWSLSTDLLAHLNRPHLKTEIESSLRNVVFLLFKNTTFPKIVVVIGWWNVKTNMNIVFCMHTNTPPYSIKIIVFLRCDVMFDRYVLTFL
jgi:hypothetical protein